MKNLIHTLLLLSIGFVLTACKKENACISREKTDFISDTITPHSYYPNYPGSYWEYDNGFVDSIPVSYSREKVFNLEEVIDSCVLERNESVLGYTKGSYFYVGNSVYTSTDVSTFESYKFKRNVVDTIIGSLVYRKTTSWSDGNGDYGSDVTEERVEEYFASMIVQGITYENVYRLRLISNAIHNYTEIETIVDNYYAENVGLIVIERFESILGPGYRKELVNYYINN